MLLGMTRIPHIAIATAVAVLVPAGSALADDPPPAHCAYSVPKTVKLKKLVSPGMPVKVTCDVATKVSPLVMFKFGTKQARKWDDIHNHGIPGIDKSGVYAVPAGQPGTARAKLWKPVAKFLKKYPRTKLKVLIGLQEPGKPYYKSIDSGKTFTVVR
jgi:hypothetical protein